MPLFARAPTLNRFSRASLLALSLMAGPAAAVVGASNDDMDFDGVPDEADAFPCDWRRASVTHVPSTDFGMLLYEDNWPRQGDLDFNDAVIAYNLAVYENASGDATGVRLTVQPRAIGAKYRSGLALRLPIDRTYVEEMSRTINGEGATSLGMRDEDEGYLVVTIVDDLRALFGEGDTYVNTEGAATGDGPVVQLDITFIEPVRLRRRSQLNDSTLDLFFFRTNDPGHEIHRPQFGGTSMMRQDLFNTEDDASNGGVNFVDGDGLPFVITLPSVTVWPREFISVDQVWPRIVTFASSGGATDSDFYLDQASSELAFDAGAMSTEIDIGYEQCFMTSCEDGTQNGPESDVDCGAACAGCQLDQACNSNSDCASGACGSSGTCVTGAAAASDSDADGLSDDEEAARGTSGTEADTDADGMSDAIELAMGTNPNVPGSRPTAQGTVLTACQPLAAGDYVLDSDIVASGTCFTANGNFSPVRIDCRGHAIIGDGSGNGIDLQVFNTDSTITNCVIRNFQNGIFMEVHNYDVSITSSVLTHNNGSGVRTNHHNYRTVITDSRASFNGSVGFDLTDWASGARVVDSFANHNGQEGVFVNVGGLFVCGTEAVGNGASCQVRWFSDSTWEESCVDSEAALAACGVRGLGEVCGADSDCASDFCSGNVCAAGLPADTDGDGLSDMEETTLGTNGNAMDSDGDGMSDGVELAMGLEPRIGNGRPAAGGTPISSCGQLTAGDYYLTQDLVATGGDCLRTDFQFAPVRIDCNGHSISGNGSGYGIHYYVHNYGGVVSNCDISGFEQGIRAYVHNYDLTVQRSHVHNNTGDGLYTGHHNYRTIVQNSRFSMNGGTGVNLTDWAQEATVRSTIVRNNRGEGVTNDYWGQLATCGNVIDGNLGLCNYNTSLLGCVTTAVSEAACPGAQRTVSIPIMITGYVASTGVSSQLGASYTVGDYFGTEYRSWFAFDVSGEPGTVVAASLTSGQACSNGTGHVLSLYDVQTPIFMLAQGAGITGFNDMGSGSLLGSYDFAGQLPTTFSVPFNNAGIGLLQNYVGGGAFVVGAHYGLGDGLMFDCNQSAAPQLVITFAD